MDNISSAFTKLHMPGMASCWRTLNETHQTDKLSFSDGLELLLQSELDYSGLNVPLVAGCNVPPIAFSNVPPQKWLL